MHPIFHQISDSVLFGLPQRAVTPESLSRPARKSGNHYRAEYILRPQERQGKKMFEVATSTCKWWGRATTLHAIR